MLELTFLKHFPQLIIFLSSWLGNKLHHNEFDKDSGSAQELLFGKCEKHVPGGAPLLQPYSKPSLQPSSKPLLQSSSKPSLQSYSQPSRTCERYACGECTLACDRITNYADLTSSVKEMVCNAITCCQWEHSECNPVVECGCSL